MTPKLQRKGGGGLPGFTAKHGKKGLAALASECLQMAAPGSRPPPPPPTPRGQHFVQMFIHRAAQFYLGSIGSSGGGGEWESNKIITGKDKETS